MQEGVFLKKARKLPSGKYNKLVYIGKDDNGKRKYHSVTADTIAEVELLAAQFKLSKKVEAKNGLTFKQGLENYIKEKERKLGYQHVMTPCVGTVKSYL